MRCEKRELIGVWQLVSAELRREGEEMLYLWGKKPVGYLIYTGSGHMSATLASGERLPFTTQDLLEASQEELAQATRSYLSYIGTYTITTGDAILHHVKACIFPNWTGEKHVRFIEELTDETLVLRSPPLLVAGKERTGYLRWTRLTRESRSV